MLDLNTLSELSRANCISICAFLVPAILLATLLTVVLVFLHRPSQQIWQSAGVASIFALVMILHVYTWFQVGIVMAPTYILLSLAITCLLTNLGALVLHRRLIVQMDNGSQMSRFSN
jgi:hypothetical protein